MKCWICVVGLLSVRCGAYLSYLFKIIMYISALDVHPTNLHQLQDAVLSIWADISKGCFQHLDESMPRRVKAVLEAKGGQTQY